MPGVVDQCARPVNDGVRQDFAKTGPLCSCVLRNETLPNSGRGLHRLEVRAESLTDPAVRLAVTELDFSSRCQIFLLGGVRPGLSFAVPNLVFGLFERVGRTRSRLALPLVEADFLSVTTRPPTVRTAAEPAKPSR